MKTLARILRAAVLALALPAAATDFATDATDAWFTPAEAGWGAFVIQQHDTLFVMLFVYTPSGQPTFYSASSATFIPTTDGSLLYQGDLFQTTGTWFGQPWQAAQLTTRKVGTLIFKMTTTADATLTYVVDGVSVTRQIQRFAFKYNNLAGTYASVMAGTYSGCSANGYSENAVIATITQSDATIGLSIADNGGSCTYSGTYFQTGRTGSMNVTGTCTSGSRPTLQMVEIETTTAGLIARATANYGGGCTWTGSFAGLRR